MRLFTALLLPREVREHLWSLIACWKRASSPAPMQPAWVRDENLHVTLKFLGEVADADLPPLLDALEAVEPPGAMKFAVNHLECLPPRGPVRIIAAGLNGDVDRLCEHYERIDRACAALGFPSERRRFRPHITMARLRRPAPAQVRSFLEEAIREKLPGPEWAASGFALIQSDLVPGGARYTPIPGFPLNRS